MFRFDPERYGHEGVVDEERDVRLEGVGGIAYSTERTALLTWGGREIPLNYDSNVPEDPKTGLQYTQFWLSSLGSSYEVFTRRGISRHSFQDEAERTQTQMLAVEALLAFSFRFASVPWAARKCSVVVDGYEWRINDFPGYPIAAGEGA